MSSLGLRMDNTVIRVAYVWVSPYVVLVCATFVGQVADSFGTHGLHCSKNTGLHSCHSAVIEVINEALASAKIAVHLEPAGICRADRKQPGIVTITP